MDKHLPAPAAAEVPPLLPDYMCEVYDWAYVNPAHVARLDHDWVVKVLLFGNDQRLIRAMLAQVGAGMSVWQVAHVYGKMQCRLAEAVGRHGLLHLTDVTRVQVEHAQRKLAAYCQASVYHADAAEFAPARQYDRVVSFFLLHEVPDDKKRAIIDNMLAHVAPGGMAVFVDYHRPRRWQPVGWLLAWVNARLEPFAHSLWQHPLAHFARDADRFDWRERTLFGGVYQLVTASRRGPC